MSSFFESLKGALNWVSDVTENVASIGESVSGLLGSTNDPGGLVLNASTSGVSRTSYSPPPTAATADPTWIMLGGLVLVGGLLFLATR